MPKPLPMPVELVVNHPEVIPLANHAYHGVLTLAVAYWRSECRPMPTTAKDLAAMARMDLRSWSAHGKAIVRCLTIVYPIIQRRMVDEVSNMQARRERAIKASAASHAAARQARAMQSINPAAQTPPQQPSDPMPAPSKAARYEGTGKTDMVAIRGGKARHAAYARVEGGGLLADAAIPAQQESPRDAYSDWNWEPTPTPPPLVEQE